jgi:leucyl aminopeptidase
MLKMLESGGAFVQIQISKDSITSLSSDCIVVTHLEGQSSIQGFAEELDNVLGQRITRLIKDKEIRGRWGEVTIIHSWDLIPSKRILVLGLGKSENLTLDRVRDAIAIASRKARATFVSDLTIGVTSRFNDRWNPVDLVQSVIEGVHLGLYRYEGFKTKKNDSDTIEKLTLALSDLSEGAIQTGVERGQIFSSATNLARDLVNTPANHMDPEILAQAAQDAANQHSLECTVLGLEELEKLGMGAFIAVSQGSQKSPRLIVMRYMGAPDSEEVLGLVGKGITFDSGGLQVKPDTGMVDMKKDMAGAAAVIGAMHAIGALQPHSNVIAVIPACENMINGNAMKPGDVIKAFNGKTIEVKHTDAEGRLVLADGVAYAKHLGVTKLIDVATLTGAVIVALGHSTTGLMSNHDEWANEVKSAAQIAGEKIWELPMFDDYKELIESDIADMKNDAGRPAGAIQGALFIREFVDGLPWAHLDIAGTSSASKEQGINPSGATGVAVRTLAQLAIRFAGK